MDNFVLRPTTPFTPFINFDAVRNTLEIRGCSYPEDVSAFYKPVFEWLEAYFSQLKEESQVLVIFDFTYFNSGTSRVLLGILDLFEDQALSRAIAIDVHWFYEVEDENMLEYGEDLQEEHRAVVFRFFEKSEEAVVN